MLSDVNRQEVREEGNLLIEAVSLLVQRQGETESWIAEQIWQAEERAAASERMYAEFEARLAGIEEYLAGLVHDVEPLRDDAGVVDRLERLREQVEGLKSSAADGRTARSAAVIAGTPGATHESGLSEPRSGPRALSAGPLAAPRPRATPSAGQGVGFWELLGSSPQDRFGLVLIGAGAVAVLYAILTQLRFG